MTLNPKDLTPGRRVEILATGAVHILEAVVTDRKDQAGWCIVKVDAPPDSCLFGHELQHEDYVPVFYIDDDEEKAP